MYARLTKYSPLGPSKKKVPKIKYSPLGAGNGIFKFQFTLYRNSNASLTITARVYRFKINTEGISTDARRGGSGGVPRSCSGFMAAWCKPYSGITDPLISEALALRDGFIFAKLRAYSVDDVDVKIIVFHLRNLKTPLQQMM